MATMLLAHVVALPVLLATFFAMGKLHERINWNNLLAHHNIVLPFKPKRGEMPYRNHGN